MKALFLFCTLAFCVFSREMKAPALVDSIKIQDHERYFDPRQMEFLEKMPQPPKKEDPVASEEGVKNSERKLIRDILDENNVTKPVETPKPASPPQKPKRKRKVRSLYLTVDSLCLTYSSEATVRGQKCESGNTKQIWIVKKRILSPFTNPHLALNFDGELGANTPVVVGIRRKSTPIWGMKKGYVFPIVDGAQKDYVMKLSGDSPEPGSPLVIDESPVSLTEASKPVITSSPPPPPSDVSAAVEGKFWVYSKWPEGEIISDNGGKIGRHLLVVRPEDGAIDFALSGGMGEYNITYFYFKRQIGPIVATCGPDGKGLKLTHDAEKLGWTLKGKIIKPPKQFSPENIGKSAKQYDEFRNNATKPIIVPKPEPSDLQKTVEKHAKIIAEQAKQIKENEKRLSVLKSVLAKYQKKSQVIVSDKKLNEKEMDKLEQQDGEPIQEPAFKKKGKDKKKGTEKGEKKAGNKKEAKPQGKNGETCTQQGNCQVCETMLAGKKVKVQKCGDNKWIEVGNQKKCVGDKCQWKNKMCTPGKEKCVTTIRKCTEKSCTIQKKRCEGNDCSKMTEKCDGDKCEGRVKQCKNGVCQVQKFEHKATQDNRSLFERIQAALKALRDKRKQREGQAGAAQGQAQAAGAVGGKAQAGGQAARREKKPRNNRANKRSQRRHKRKRGSRRR